MSSAARLATGLAFVALILIGGPACSSSPAPPAAPRLQPRETFDWSGEKISFSIPPAGWRREGETSGGIKGARFVKERSVGEAVGLGDYYILADRNRSGPIRDILAKFDTYDYGFAWDRAIRTAYAYTDTPFSSLESEIAERVNSEVGLAGAAYRNRDRDAAKAHLEAALAEASRLHFSLDEVIARVEFTPERRQNPEWYHMLGRRETIVAGESAVIVDYTVKVPERPQTYSAREAYFVHNSHLFICTFIGLKETLPVFDAMVASIEFPKVEFGAHRVQVTAPAGWETLDQGNRKRFRNGEFEIVLENLGPSTSLRPGPPTPPARDFDELIDWGLAALGHDQRREVKSRATVTIDGREAMNIETWNRLDHSNPQRVFLVRDDGDVLVLHTVGMANAESLTAFDSIRHSLHFVSARR